MAVQHSRTQPDILIPSCEVVSLTFLAKLPKNIRMKEILSMCTFLVLILHLTLGCPWTQHTFQQYSRKCLTLLEEMVSIFSIIWYAVEFVVIFTNSKFTHLKTNVYLNSIILQDEKIVYDSVRVHFPQELYLQGSHR